ncbi:MAG: ABC transporter permease [Candidatus Bathyarchaeota archaeon]|nr:MAG: ABC transporter permease [Candidatus Bathyarchaeota archaeon]
MNQITKSEEETDEVYEPSTATQLFTVWRKLKASKLAVFGGGIVLAVILIAIFGVFFTPYGPGEMWVYDSLRPPFSEAILGSDDWGRDMFSLLVLGARVSLYVGFSAVLLEAAVGLTIGMIAGYFGGLIDEVLMRITDVVLTLPTLMLLIIAVSMFQIRGLNVIILVSGLLGWPFLARVVRSEFLTLKEATFVEAARSVGVSNWRIITRHILPNAMASVIVLLTMDIPWYIFYEASLTFLGFGDPTAASWGILMEKGRRFLGTEGWWIATFPGLAILITSLGFNLFGDGLRDALDVKTRAR